MSKISATTRSVDPQMMAWDTEFWGVRVGRAERLDGLSEWAAANTVGLVCLLVDTVREVQEAEERGFRLMDVRVTLEQSLENMGVFVEPQPALPSEHGDIERIAHGAFTLSRFYADPRLDDADCGALYASWARQGIEAGTALVERSRSGYVRGFVTMALEGRGASIELIATGPEDRRKGAGRQLVLQGMRWAQDRGATSISVVTQGRNVGALRVFEGAGFRITGTQFWLHKWYDA